MTTVAHHQDAAARFLALADAESQAGNSYRSVLALSRATTHAATAANLHWGMFHHTHRRQLGHVLLILASKRHISYTSARSIHKFNTIHRAIEQAERARNLPAARRIFRNSRRRTARIIDSVNRAIAADPNPKPYWQISAEVAAAGDAPPPQE